MPDVTASVIAVTFTFFSFSIFKDIPYRVELGKGMLTGLLSGTVIGIIVVYLIYGKLKPGQTNIKPDDNPGTLDGIKPEEKPGEPADKEVCVELTVTISKTTNSGSSSAVSREHVSVQMEKKGFKNDEEESPPAVHTGTQNKVEPDTISNQTNDRQQSVLLFRPQPPLPQNSEIKDRSLRGISATVGDTLDLASETPRPIKLPPLTAKQETVQEADASKEPKTKRKRRKKKEQVNEKTLEDENETEE